VEKPKNVGETVLYVIVFFSDFNYELYEEHLLGPITENALRTCSKFGYHQRI
jgi:hypothetical protein